jgi:hypothetical protein
LRKKYLFQTKETAKPGKSNSTTWGVGLNLISRKGVRVRLFIAVRVFLKNDRITRRFFFLFRILLKIAGDRSVERAFLYFFQALRLPSPQRHHDVCGNANDVILILLSELLLPSSDMHRVSAFDIPTYSLAVHCELSMYKVPVQHSSKLEKGSGVASEQCN